jgi:uncharacterized SAM-binding protein YcdF (DUF218 family)
LLAVLLILTTVGALRLRDKRRPRYLVPAAVLLFLYCWPPVSMLVWRAVQSRYSRTPPAPEDAGAIVILAGGVRQPFPPRDAPLLGDSTFGRCSYGAWYYHHAARLPVLLSGGRVEARDAEPYAYSMKTFILEMGIPESQVWIEDRSRSTAENAIYTARILREKGVRKIVLVTDVGHMLRARRCFEKQGILVIPAPCGFRPVYEFDGNDALPALRAIEWNEQLVHESIGLAWYWLRGLA